ncbi:MAG TPA: SIMPL domain-containing protein [Phycisphaerae bacterium]|nr:SIMPL domain-containing protein [Phycisphaerae bacterium]HOJ75245.1 SIMPL domain-containing protein [Phycisphaerae bacterium]HOM52390.1 SIMPL domain-containing protein [Phycisphaerae bacterium]HPP27437.1 SIMPL domain-containing protein [Phycisphaerae bacterium]HPU26019.1 SIMPL domain-containing protein [Phycisphaerae bacterium]
MSIVPKLLTVILLSQFRPPYFDGGGALMSSKSATLEKPPEAMRLRVEIPAHGPDVRQALAKLAQKREAAVKKLRDLGFPEDAIRVEGPNLGVDPLEIAKRQMGMMMDEEEEDVEEAEKPPAKVHLSLFIQADFPLRPDDKEALLAAAHELQNKLHKADLAGLRDEKPTEEEEEEMMELKQRMLQQFSSGDDQAIPGVPLFAFVSKITEEDRATLVKSALAKAKADIESLARAAGVQLGAMSGLSAHFEKYAEDWRYQFDYSGTYQRQLKLRAMSPDENEDEALTADPGPIRVRMTVNLAYQIKSPDAVAATR